MSGTKTLDELCKAATESQLQELRRLADPLGFFVVTAADKAVLDAMGAAPEEELRAFELALIVAPITNANDWRCLSAAAELARRGGNPEQARRAEAQRKALHALHTWLHQGTGYDCDLIEACQDWHEEIKGRCAELAGKPGVAWTDPNDFERIEVEIPRNVVPLRADDRYVAEHEEEL